MKKLTNDEYLALVVAVDKTVAAKAKEAKGAACAAMVAQAMDGESDRRPILVGGAKVGEVGASYSKPGPVITDMGKAIEALREKGLTVEVPAKGWEEHFTAVAGLVADKDTAELVEWAAWEPKRVKGAAVRIPDSQAVLDAFGTRIADGGGALKLLEAGA